MGWFGRSLRAGPSSLRDEAACCTASSPKASVPIADEVSAMSPARLLARSLTECETRDEWTKEVTSFGVGTKTTYHNKVRGLTITRAWYVLGYSYQDTIDTDFTLTEAEKRAVREATCAFDRRESEERQAEALSRLTAPREGLKPDRGETAKTGSTAKPRKPVPKGRAQPQPPSRTNP